MEIDDSGGASGAESGQGIEEGGQQLRLLAAAFQATQEGIVITDTELEQPGPRILAVNPAFCRISGYSEEEVLGKTPRILQGPRSDRSLLRRIKPILASGQIFRGETYNYRKNGEEFLMRWYITPVFNSPKTTVTHYVAVQQDVTEENRLRSIAQTVNSMDNMGYVFAGVRHQLGNPVNSTKAALNLVRTHLDSLPKEKVVRYLDAVLEELERIEQLLGTLRSFSSHDRVRPENLSIRGFLDQFLGVLEVPLVDRGIAFRCIVPEELGEALADGRALHQALLNLICNSMDALEDRPAPAITLRVARRRRCWLFIVEDNGIGMSEDQQQDLFKPFHTTKVEGNGLGLVLSRKLVTQMWGSVHIESTQGVGTVATISLERIP